MTKGMLFDRLGLATLDCERSERDLPARIAELLQHDRRARELRRTIFDTGVINDSCWHILQDLFAAHLSGEQVRTKHLNLSTGLPSTTVLRYLDHLEAFDAISRQDDPTDNRVTLVSLTTAGLQWMHEYYEQMALEGMALAPSGQNLGAAWTRGASS
jgi:hypothetical protein